MTRLMMMRLQKARHCPEPRVITGHECALNLSSRRRRGESKERENAAEQCDAVAFTTMMLDTIPERDTAKSRCTPQ
jgi:hypothetical protein